MLNHGNLRASMSDKYFCHCSQKNIIQFWLVWKSSRTTQIIDLHQWIHTLRFRISGDSIGMYWQSGPIDCPMETSDSNIEKCLQLYFLGLGTTRHYLYSSQKLIEISIKTKKIIYKEVYYLFSMAKSYCDYWLNFRASAINNKAV